MTQRDPDPWTTDDADTDALLARVLGSSAADEPSAARVDALVARVSAATSTTPPAADVPSGPWSGAVPSASALASKVATVVTALALVGAGAWLFSLRREEPRNPAPAALPVPAAPAPVIASPVPAAPGPVRPTPDPKLPAVSAPNRRSVDVRRPDARAQRTRAEPAPAPALAVPQLEREVRLLDAMRKALGSDPCGALRLGAQHRAEFTAPLLGPERDQLIDAAQALRARADGGTCAP